MRIINKLLVIVAALTLLGGQTVFAGDQIRKRTRDRSKDQTCINDGSGTKTRNTKQHRNMKQVKTTSKTAKQSDK